MSKLLSVFTSFTWLNTLLILSNWY